MKTKPIPAAAAAAATAAALLLIGGCSSGHDSGSPGNPIPGPGATAGTAPGIVPGTGATPDVDPCVDEPSCVRLGSADVDGDGTDDTIGIGVSGSTVTAYVGRAGTVTTASVVTTPVVGNDYSPEEGYIGAFRMRGPGADIVFHAVRGGGNPEQFVVFGWDDGHLRSIPKPPSGRESAIDMSHPGVWFLTSSHGTLTTARCLDGERFAMEFTQSATAQGSPVPGGGYTLLSGFRWVSGGWVPDGEERTASGDIDYPNIDVHRDSFACEDQTKNRR